MTGIGPDLTKTAEDLANFAKEAAYVAIGMGVLGFHKTQVRRHELAGAAGRAGQKADLQGSLAEARRQLAKRVKDFDATVEQVIKALDTTLEPMWERLPESAQAVVQQARDARDQVRSRVLAFTT